ncbi:MAG: hypothetical protein EBW38_09510 [Rhodobacteraceae bacterium]|nr:hypothetical protein [Paracoccaceae bacterium]
MSDGAAFVVVDHDASARVGGHRRDGAVHGLRAVVADDEGARSRRRRCLAVGRHFDLGVGLHLRGEVLRPDGSEAINDHATAPIEDAAILGQELAKKLLSEAGEGFFDWRE